MRFLEQDDTSFLLQEVHIELNKLTAMAWLQLVSTIFPMPSSELFCMLPAN